MEPTCTRQHGTEEAADSVISDKDFKALIQYPKKEEYFEMSRKMDNLNEEIEMIKKIQM